VLTACGAERGTVKAVPTPADQSPPGQLSPPTADGRSNEASAQTGEHVASLDRTARAGHRRDRPCELVSARAAEAILGAAIKRPFQAPQGPSCVYITRDRSAFVTLAMKQGDFALLSKDLAQRTRTPVLNRPTYCGMHGQPTLYADVSDGYVLTVAAECNVAKQFAGVALRALAR
jgi:hypothetical protein